MEAKYIELPLYLDGETHPATVNTAIPSLFIYPAQQPSGKAIIMCPGGGLTKVAMEHEGHDMAPWFIEQGITFAILKYRMPNQQENILSEDIRQAIRTMRSLSGKYCFKELGVMGASIGGYIAAGAAVFPEADTCPDFQILFYPVISMKQAYTHIPSRTQILGEHPSVWKENDFSLECHVKDNTPKAFIAAASDDKAVSPVNSTLYYDALLKHGVSACLHIYPEGGHSFAFRDTFPYKTLLLKELKAWLSQSQSNG